VRRLLQVFGTEVGRKLIADDIWVTSTLSQLDPDGKYVITDCRFPNEAAAIKELGGTMIRIIRHGYQPVNAHVSETSLDDYPFDYVLWNNSTIEKMHETLRSFVCKSL
jgi:hypothetical protein